MPVRVTTSSHAFRQACADPDLRRERCGEAAASLRLLVGLLAACPTLEAVIAQPPISVTPASNCDDVVVGFDGAGGRVELIATVSDSPTPEIVVHAMRIFERSAQ